MSAKKTKPSLQPSLLDRLTDREPKVIGEPAALQSQSIREVMQGLRRDLEWLLNSRAIPIPIPPGLKRLPRSVFAYGLPDITGLGMNSDKDRRALVGMLEDSITAFEPRLTAVAVSILPAETAARVIRLRIDGMLKTQPAPERVSFDTTLNLASSTYQVEGERRAG